MSRKRSKKTTIRKDNKPKQEIKVRQKKNGKVLTAILLIAVFSMVLFMNSYFNYDSDSAFNEDGTTLGTRFYLSGPDPYYNMRLCEVALEKGYYPYVDGDPLLNYPSQNRGGARPPLFNSVAFSTAAILENFMPQMDALGWLMLWLPALYGALLVFPLYFLGKELINKKTGMLAAFLVAIIPIHVSSGHGSSFSLFDHDSFLLLLFTLTFMFVVFSIKSKDRIKSVLYAMLGGLCVGAIQMTWVAAEFIFTLLMVTMVVIFVFDLFGGKNEKNALSFFSLFITAFLIQLPYAMQNILFEFPAYAVLMSLALVVFQIFIKKIKMPWTVTLPSIVTAVIMGLAIIYAEMRGIISFPSLIASPIRAIGRIIFGSGIYGNKVALTIAEANTYNFSRTAMSFGPVLFPTIATGILLFIWMMHREKYKPHHIFFMILVVVEIWLLSTAGRFINDLVPLFAVLGAFAITFTFEKLNYKKAIATIKQVRGFSGIKKATSISKIFGIVFIIMLLVPNTYMTLDAAVPNFPAGYKQDLFGEDHRPAFGNSLYKELYWSDALHWLSQQDNETEPEQRPAFISWWDYGFFEVAIGKHPTVADNYQEGIEPAANFHTSESEEEAVAVLSIRLMYGARIKTSTTTSILNESVKSLLREHLPSYNKTIANGNETQNMTKRPAEEIITIMEDFSKAPSYDTLIHPEYGNDVYKVSAENAAYHDITRILLEELDDEELTWLYHDMQNETGFSIRYYGVEGYDARDIFSVFTFLADKGVHGQVTSEDDYFKTVYVDKNGFTHTSEELRNMSTAQMRELAPLKPRTTRKDAYFETMVLRTYYGWKNEGNTFPENSIPTYGLRHFVPVYISPYPYSGARVPAVVIAKYYEGAKISGRVTVGNEIPYNGAEIIVYDEYASIPHDSSRIGFDSLYDIIAPAGEIELKIYVANELLTEIRFNTTENPSITENEAMRFNEFNRTVDINIPYANISGSVNGTNETELNLTLNNVDYSGITQNIETKNLTYSFNRLIPSHYQLIATNNAGIELYNQTRFIRPGDNMFNFTAIYPEVNESIADNSSDNPV